MREHLLLLLIAVCCTLTLSPGQTHAAAVYFEIGPTFDGPSGYEAIITEGTLVEAVNYSTTTDTIIVDSGGLAIPFTPADDYGPAAAYSHGSPGSSDTGWNDVIDMGDDFSWTSLLSLSGLQPGTAYQIQIFSADLRPCCAADVVSIADGGVVQSTEMNWIVGEESGTFTSVIGTFVADGSTQQVFTGPVVLNAYVLRALPAVPEERVIQFGVIDAVNVASAQDPYAGHAESGFEVGIEGEWTYTDAVCVRKPCLDTASVNSSDSLVITGGPTGWFRFEGAWALSPTGAWSVRGYRRGELVYSYGESLPAIVGPIPPPAVNLVVDELRIDLMWARIDDIRVTPVEPVLEVPLSDWRTRAALVGGLVLVGVAALSMRGREDALSAGA